MAITDGLDCNKPIIQNKKTKYFLFLNLCAEVSNLQFQE